ncbi:FtsX-like permease family protein [Streptomyces sp. NPDC048384]|uniref:FtsX-like permease family protein n=1 Tax=Streptomyces sp. NPDC048384 TaxID=3155487 RepID=UPI003438CE3A
MSGRVKDSVQVRPDPPRRRKEPGQASPSGLARWGADLALGVRLSICSGPQSWFRSLLTAVGVGLGVAVLLLAASVPDMLAARSDRSEARAVPYAMTDLKAGPGTAVVGSGGTEFRGRDVLGYFLQPEGPSAPVPPGVKELPKPGEMVASPALAELLQSSNGALLRERLDFRVTGTIGDDGLLGPDELYYYAGAPPGTLEKANHVRIDHWGTDSPSRPLRPLLTLLVVLGSVVLLVPVASFIAMAVRFGGERRDRRLAALRLVGADSQMIRRIAAGEPLIAALLGLATGIGLFLLGRQFAGNITLWGKSAFASDIQPSVVLAALICLGVLVSAVLATLFALRSVVIEPLGVVRTSAVRRRRVWWRVLLPAVGVVLLVSLMSAYTGTQEQNIQLVLGATFLLAGLTAFLPWLLEASVTRAGGGPLPWQLAARRLQLSSGPAARAVSSVTVAVAGAIALQMLFPVAQSENTKSTGRNHLPGQAQVLAPLRAGAEVKSAIGKLKATQGVDAVIAITEAESARALSPGKDKKIRVSVADCATLRQITKIRRCNEGDVFLALPGGEASKAPLSPGLRIDLGDTAKGKSYRWKVPKSAVMVDSKETAGHPGILVTPSALDMARLGGATASISVRLDAADPDAIEHVRNTAAAIHPVTDVDQAASSVETFEFSKIKRGLLIGATLTLLLIAASMAVTTLEQLRERKRLLAVFMAFGARRSTLMWSLAWQTAIPVALGLALAVAAGVGLGSAVLRMVSRPVVVDWTNIATMTGAGAGLIAVVTGTGLIAQWRMMRPDGLRTE